MLQNATIYILVPLTHYLTEGVLFYMFMQIFLNDRKTLNCVCACARVCELSVY